MSDNENKEFNLGKKTIVGELLLIGSTLGLKTCLFGGLGIIGTFISKAFGGWDSSMTTLVIFMGIDYISGLIVKMMFKRNQNKEQEKVLMKLDSGLPKKAMALFIVLAAYRLDLVLGQNMMRQSAIIAYTLSELLSIVENAGLIGVPIPAVIKKSIDLLGKKGEVHANSNR